MASRAAAPVALDRRLLLVDEMLLAVVSIATAIGFSRLFRDNSFFWRIALLSICSHVVAALCRRYRLHIALSAAISAAALALATAVVIYPQTTWALLPTTTTKDRLFDDLRSAWNLFGNVRAPAPVEVGFVVAAAAAMWVVAFLADWAAFRLWSTVEALLPAGIVFVFAALLGRGQSRFTSTAWFAAAVLAFALVHRLVKAELGASWLARDPNDGRVAVARVGMLAAISAVVLGLVVGPALPGAKEDPVFAWRSLDGGGGTGGAARVTVSPLVDIRARLVTQSNIEVFTVKSPRPDYWRLTALDKFDGTAWTSSGAYVKARENLPSKLPPAVATTTLRQTFSVKALTALWMPAAYEPAAVIDDGDTDARYEPESGTLTVKEGKATSDGVEYTIDSRIPQRTPNDVRAGSNSTLTPEFRVRYTDLPQEVSSYLNGFLRTATGRNGPLIGLRNNKTPYDQALQLQEYFRTFEYSLTVASGHSVTDIQSFLGVRKGYCEQFAGAFAAIMRQLGVPARVAVGFTPGTLGDDGLFHVRGEHAHAWPEVFIDTVGWVRFEPTPGRGAPGDEAITRQPPQQAQTDQPTESAPVPTLPEVDPNDPNLADLPPDLAADINTIAPGGTGGSGDSPLAGIGQLVAIAVGIAGLGFLMFGAVPLLKHLRRRQRHLRATSVRQKITASWADAVDSLGLLGLPAKPSETPAQVVSRIEGRLGEAESTFASLADMATRANYAPDDPPAAAVDEAAASAQAVRSAIAGLASRRTRIRQALDPRPLLPRAQLRN